MGKGSYLYKTDDNSLLKDFKIYCIESELTLKEGLELSMRDSLKEHYSNKLINKK